MFKKGDLFVYLEGKKQLEFYGKPCPDSIRKGKYFNSAEIWKVDKDEYWAHDLFDRDEVYRFCH